MFSLMPTRKGRRVAGTLMPPGYSPMEWLREEFAPLFERAFAGFPVPFEPYWELPIPWGFETEETEKEVLVRVELPGFEPAEIKVELTGSVLTIIAEHPEVTKAAKGAKPIEIYRNKVRRTLTLPEGIEVEHVEAVYRNGILEVHLPKKEEVKPRYIEVKT